ncbi:MAG: response regulator [Desulfarculaceae bacterium]|nr:response regulator [Desulfarculaceae bacterium]
MADILLATRDKALFSRMIDSFESNGYTVNTAESGNSALSEIEQGGYRLLIADEELSDMSGKTLVEKTVAQNPMMDCVAVSTLSEEEFHEAFEGMGVLMQFPPEPGKTDVQKLMAHLDKIASLSIPQSGRKEAAE